MSDVTRILSLIEARDPSAAEQLLPLVYDELRKLAAAKLSHENPGQTLQATALVHEAYLRLVGGSQSVGASNNAHADSPADGPNNRPAAAFDSRGHFFAAAAEAMRRILVENARRKQRVRHGGEMERLEIELAELPTRMEPEELIALDEALARLREEDAVKAQLITLRYFGGMTIEQAAEVLKISRVTAFRYWTFARAWLHREITGKPPQATDSG
jgi:RNA polymerase sigma factor (sigma-70 family)